MKYFDKLIELIHDPDEFALENWILSQPLLEQPDIFRELKELTEAVAAEVGDDPNEMVKGFESFEDRIDEYEDQILDEKLAEAQLVMAIEERDKAFAEMDEEMAGVREYLIECIVNNEPNAPQMRELAVHVIKYETDAGLYDPENWKIIGL